MARRITLLLGTCALLLPSPAPAAEARILGHGNLTITLKVPPAPAVSCTALSVVEFAVTGSTFTLHEQILAGQTTGTPPVCTVGSFTGYSNAAPSIQQCTAVGGVATGSPTLTVLGNKYTVNAPYTTCAGKSETDTIVMTVSATSIVYRHDQKFGDLSEVHVTGTLTRDV